MTNNPHTYCVILAGGGGTRLWPESRNKTPKQFLRLTSNQTMMQLAANRAKRLVDYDHMIVVTNKLYEKEVARQLPNVPAQNILAEPERKETAMAMLVGALYARLLDPKAVVFNLASDHTVINNDEFTRVMRAALTIAAKNQQLVAIGITPTYPTTGYGYIKSGQLLEELDHDLPLLSVDEFKEKPDQQTAQRYIASGKYYWNANMYVWSAETLANAFAKYKPNLYDRTKKLANLKPDEFHQELAKIYDGAEKISIDYAISEKADNLVLIPGNFGWNDVGDWKIVWDLSDKDENQNVDFGNPDGHIRIFKESKGNLVNSTKKLVALISVEDMIVVETDSTLLVMPRAKSQEVKKIVQKLKDEGLKEYL